MERYGCRLTKRITCKGTQNDILHTGQVEAINRAAVEQKIREEINRVETQSDTIKVVKAEILIDGRWHEIRL